MYPVWKTGYDPLLLKNPEYQEDRQRFGRERYPCNELQGEKEGPEFFNTK